MAQSELTIKISANVVQALGGIESVKQKLEQMSKSTMTASERFVDFSAKLSAVSIAFQSVSRIMGIAVSAAKDVITAYSAQEQAERRLQTVLTATQNAVGMSATELYNLAESLSEVTTYSDQEIIAVEQMLAATRRIGRDVLPEATRAVLDMAAATGDDATGAAKDLAQALADPAGEIESLKEKGIQLTEEQAENIKKVQEQNGVYEAQKLLLKEVAETYGGMAEAIASTDTGKLQQISNVWNDIKEGLGEGLLDRIGPALDWLYERLQDIEELINNWQKNDNIEKIALSGGSFDEYNDFDLLDAYQAVTRRADTQNGAPRTYSERIAAGIRRELDARNLYYNQDILSPLEREAYERSVASLSSGYGKWLSEYRYQNGRDPSLETIQRGIDVGELNANDVEMYNRNLMEKGYYDRLIQSRFSAFASPSTVTPASIQQNLEQLNGITGSLSVQNPAFSLSDYMQSLVGMTPRSIITPRAGSATSAEEAVVSAVATPRNPLGDFINQYGSFSSSYQMSRIDDAIRASQSWMAEVEPDSDAFKMLHEINEALYEQKEAFREAGDEASTWQEELLSSLPSIVDSFMSIVDSIGDIFSNMADAAEDELQRIEDKWDEYFEELDEKQDRQVESLNAMLASGNISYEDYIDAMNGLDETRAEAMEKAQEEEAAQREKANELGQAAFAANQANQLAEVAMNTASAIMGAWADNPNPVVAGIMTGIISAASAAQIAAISSQKYTPLAAGGITQGPTRTLLGEGNPHELVMPLTEGNLERFGLGSSERSGVINITVNIGAAYTGEQLTEDVFRGIERAQRTGALPHWRYA